MSKYVSVASLLELTVFSREVPSFFPRMKHPEGFLAPLRGLEKIVTINLLVIGDMEMKG